MIGKEFIQSIKEKEMDRKTFLKYSGLSILSLVGFNTIMALLSKVDDKKLLASSKKSDATGYGGGKYGV